MLDPNTQKNLDMWLTGDIDSATKDEIGKMQNKNPEAIVDAFYTQLTFGTGGLRGIMGVGTNRMNRYTVRQATQGLANYLSKQHPQKNKLAVFIGFDSRHNSRLFAEEAAKVLAGNQLRVYLCKELRPTPFVSFGCRNKGCSAAIMVTASHNPPEYNGYKVYWQDGGQVVPPHDVGIIEEVKRVTDFSMVKSIDTVSHPLIEEVGSELDLAYLEELKKHQHYPNENSVHGKDLRIVYTSLHGAGITLVPPALNMWGFKNLSFVDKQVIPDGDFPTAKNPNPEKKEALALGIKKLHEVKGDLLIATDPDCDRVGVAVMHKGEALFLSGNQIACLCLYHLLNALKGQEKLAENAAFVKTIATTELFKKIAESYQAACFEVLTGFKYIAEKMLEWEKTGDYRYIFGGEESYGYLLGTYARDKDAVISSCLIAEVALHAKLQKMSLIDLLYEIYEKYGVYTELVDSITFEETKLGREQMENGMEKLQLSTPKQVLNVPVTYIEDYKQSIRTETASGKTSPLDLPKSNAFRIWLEDGTKLLIRPSGTEPKIKLYCGVVERNPATIEEGLERGSQRAEAYLSSLREVLTESNTPS